jgi:hypothetical protein
LKDLLEKEKVNIQNKSNIYIYIERERERESNQQGNRFKNWILSNFISDSVLELLYGLAEKI